MRVLYVYPPRGRREGLVPFANPASDRHEINQVRRRSFICAQVGTDKMTCGVSPK